MSRASRHANAAEEKTSALFNVERLGGTRKKRAVADTRPVRLADGRMLQPEVKSRKHLPKLLTDALAQAKKYAPTAEPIAIFYAYGDPNGVAVLDARLFAELVGLRDAEAGAQLSLAIIAPSPKKALPVSHRTSVRTRHQWLVGGCVELANGTPVAEHHKVREMFQPDLPPTCWKNAPGGIVLVAPPIDQGLHRGAHLQALSARPFRVEVYEAPLGLDGESAPRRLVAVIEEGQRIPDDLFLP